MTADVNVIRLGPVQEHFYAEFANHHPGMLISYSLQYRDLLVDVLGCRPEYAFAVRGETVVGILPLMSITGEYGVVLNALPYFGSNGAPLATDSIAQRALLAWYEEQAQEENVVAATMIGNPLDPDAGIPRHDLSDHRIGHLTELPNAPDPAAAILNRIEPSARRNVKKAERAGVTVRIENESFDLLEDLHHKAMSLMGGQTKEPRFFTAVQVHFGEGADYNLYVARIQDVPVAALLVFYSGNAVDYYVPAVNPTHRADQPMAALLIRALSDAARSGMRTWNWGGSWPSQESLRGFKSKWSGRARTYSYFTKLNDQSLLRIDSQRLGKTYPGFYVVPFASLEKD